MRALVAFFFLAGCSSTSSAAADAAPTDATTTSDALACEAGIDPSGGIGPSCPHTSDDVLSSCVSAASFVYETTCANDVVYQLGFGIDTAKRCFYDRTTRVLVGVSSTLNVQQLCWGSIDVTDCAGGSTNLCATDAATGE